MNTYVFGGSNDISMLKLLLKEEPAITYMPFKQSIRQGLQKLNCKGIVVLAKRRTMANACKLLDAIKQSIPSCPIVLISAIKDSDLLYKALKVNLVDLIITDQQQQILESVRKAFLLMPQNSPRKRILAIGAHPDDIEIGCGGTLLKHQEQNHDITILTLTQGSNGGNKAKRVGEAQRAAEFINSKLIITDLPDTKLSEGNPTIGIIQDAIKASRPDIIYTHSLNDTHQDHRATYNATLVAARSVSQVFSYLAPSTNVAFTPNHFEVICPFIDQKQTLINFHVSQTQGMGRPYLTPSIIKSTAQYWGRFANYSYCEPFEVIKS